MRAIVGSTRAFRYANDWMGRHDGTPCLINKLALHLYGVFFSFRSALSFFLSCVRMSFMYV